LLLAFVLSGIVHELVINVPLYLAAGSAPFGGMIVFFLIQAVAILFERRVFPRSGLANRIFLWGVVTIPAPLVFNEAFLRVFRLL
jgi:hypothetical protein